MIEYSTKYKREKRRIVTEIDFGDSGFLKRTMPDVIFGLILGAIITFVYMYMNNDSIICTEYYCYAHRHSYVCYLGWMVLNGYICAVGMTILVFIISYPLLYNLKVFLCNLKDGFKLNRLTKPSKEDKKNQCKESMNKFLNFRSMRF